MSKRTPGLYRRLKAGRREWHSDKWIKRHGRLCESTGTDDEEEAKRYMEKRIRETREAVVYGVRRTRTFREAATKYLTEYAHKPSIGRSALPDGFVSAPAATMDLHHGPHVSRCKIDR